MPKRPGSDVGWSRTPLDLSNLIPASFVCGDCSQIFRPRVTLVDFRERVSKPRAPARVERAGGVSEVARVLFRRVRLVEQNYLGREHGHAGRSLKRHAPAPHRHRRVAPEREPLSVNLVEHKLDEVGLVRAVPAPDRVEGRGQKFALLPSGQPAVVRLLKTPTAAQHVVTNFELILAGDGNVDVLVRARDAAEEEVYRPAAADVPLAAQVSEQRA